MKKSILVSMLVLGTALFATDSNHKMQNMNHNQHSINSTTKVNPNIPQDARCAVCGMYVAKYQRWASYIKTNNKTYYFDGPKDMMRFYANPTKFDKNANLEKAIIKVTDYYTLEEIDAKNAFYVTHSEIFGPMGDKFAPFKTKESANKFLKEHFGEAILSFDEIQNKFMK